MPLAGSADSKQLAILTQVLKDYCAKQGIDCPTERDYLATILMSLYASGNSDAPTLQDKLERTVRGANDRRSP